MKTQLEILGILLTPVLTRMYTPEAFGLAALFGSIVVIPAVFATMGYHSAIVLPKNNSLAKTVLLLCFCSIIYQKCFRCWPFELVILFRRR